MISSFYFVQRFGILWAVCATLPSLVFTYFEVLRGLEFLGSTLGLSILFTGILVRTRSIFRPPLQNVTPQQNLAVSFKISQLKKLLIKSSVLFFFSVASLYLCTNIWNISGVLIALCIFYRSLVKPSESLRAILWTQMNSFSQPQKSMAREAQGIVHDLIKQLEVWDSAHKSRNELKGPPRVLSELAAELQSLLFERHHTDARGLFSPADDVMQILHEVFIYSVLKCPLLKTTSVSIYIDTPKKISVASHTLVRILNNALINSLEALENAREENHFPRLLEIRIETLATPYLKGEILNSGKTLSKISSEFSAKIPTTSEKGDGHGFGVFNILSLANKNGGSASLTSRVRQPQTLTSLVFELPIKTDITEKQSFFWKGSLENFSNLTAVELSNFTKMKRVILVDDDLLILNTWKMTLANSPFQWDLLTPHEFEIRITNGEIAADLIVMDYYFTHETADELISRNFRFFERFSSKLWLSSQVPCSLALFPNIPFFKKNMNSLQEKIRCHFE